ncbi:MAG: DNA polymerase III subunit beta [Deltaproteobacteria bacterium]|nr:DNA polymerase III subunit beta [Deltaproteobacteria bacterium]
MKVVFDKAEFMRALELQVSREGRSLIELFSMVLVKANNEGIKLISSNGEEIAESLVPGDVKQPGEVCLKFDVLYDIVKDLSSREVILDYDVDQRKVVLTSGKSRYRLVAFDHKDFPLPAVGESAPIATISALELRRILELTAFPVSKSAPDQNANKLFISQSKSDPSLIEFVGTDMCRLALLRVNIDASSFFGKMSIPVEALDDLKGFIGCLADHDIVAILDYGKFIALKTEYSSLSILKGGDKFLDYKVVLKESFINSIKLNLEDLYKAVKRISSLAGEGNVIKISMEKDKIILTARNYSLGEGEEELDILDGTVEPMAIMLNSSYLTDFLRLPVQVDSIWLDSNGHDEAIRLRLDGVDGYEYYIMTVDEEVRS